MDSLTSPHPKRARHVVAAVLIVFLGGVVALSMGLSTTHRTSGLTTTTVSNLITPYPSKNLPPSRDNDAGRARSIDSTPDNDTDAWQRG
ncbi:MAG: hypothetical protein PXZ08_10020 [Actinomycetota bacterium]|nr:hypothetical protein [Actinomycetota bacterium]